MAKSNTILKFINQILMEEEDLETKPSMLHDSLALQATEKSFYDALNNNLDKSFSNHTNSRTSSDTASFVESYWNHNNMGDFGSLITSSQVHLSSYGSSKGISHAANMPQVCRTTPFWFSNSESASGKSDPRSSAGKGDISPFSLSYDFLGHDLEPNKKNSHYIETVEQDLRDRSPNSSGGVNRNLYREDDRNNELLDNNVGESEQLEMYDDLLRCSNLGCPAGKKQGKGKMEPRQKGGKKKRGSTNEIFVDLRSLLMQCAQAAANFDSSAVNDLLQLIWQHSSPHGDSTERVAYYFANALEARLAGTGTALYGAVDSKRISSAQILKTCKMYITWCPFKSMSTSFANKTIWKLAIGVSTLHVIDFGILYGFQWPCLIMALSERPGGPPKLRITGIDFPQPGFRPAERVEDTGRRLAKYCERFGVPFEYNAIAQNWDTIKVEDVKIQKGESVVVNSLFRLQNVVDDTETINCPRDVVLNLIRKINPDVFIHGVANGTYNMPFFATRFREAYFHLSSLFDMFEATIPPEENENRLVFEQHSFGQQIMSVIACEGTERVERPETYKQSQIRNIRAGFRQLPLDQEIVKRVTKLKSGFHNNFSVDEDGNWVLLGWKGRVINAMSCWKPDHSDNLLN